jgi:arylsulfatase B
MRILAVFFLFAAATLLAKPNIVVVMTDDQGYGDLACHGNPVIKTPNIDKLHGESTSLSNYHVAPTCSPTRAALLTGHWTNRTGVWHTIMGRSMLRANEITIGQHLKDSGYQTGMFGKWHLGDNYPYRPEDRGFTEVYRHGGGGVGQTPDVWDNSYFDGGYFHNGKIVPAKGFCTDVFFEAGNAFIAKSAKAKQPFFAYISLNAPHSPLHAPQKYLDMYKDQNSKIAGFYGMITNIDDNVGKTRALLKDLGVYDNTIFIFTTDNGTASGSTVFNAGMRGKKGSEYDGGHRVPFMIHWPAAGWNKQFSNNTLTHAVDIVPTLLGIAGGKAPAGYTFDGVSIRPLLDPVLAAKIHWAPRFLVTDSQRVVDPIKWRKSAVMSQQFRLVNGTELYDIEADPGQAKNVADKHPEQVKAMRGFYERWWDDISPSFPETTEIYLGQPGEAEARLTGHDWIQAALPPWNQGHIRTLSATIKKKQPVKHDGHWAVKVIQDGRYQIDALRWPPEANKAITTALPAGEQVPGASKAFRANPGKALAVTKASLVIDGKNLGSKPVPPGAARVSFQADLKAGSHKLAPIFHIKGGTVGAYYCVVRKLP